MKKSLLYILLLSMLLLASCNEETESEAKQISPNGNRQKWKVVEEEAAVEK